MPKCIDPVHKIENLCCVRSWKKMITKVLVTDPYVMQ